MAVTGPPGSGKSTLAEALAPQVGALGRTAQVVPMDGFHLDNRLLDERGLRARKGAPETFDAAGFVALVERLKAGGDVIHPVFDRNLDLAIAGAGAVPASCEIVLVEGNYLLFAEAPWDAVASLWDLSVFLEVDEATLSERLVQRWRDHGHDEVAAQARAEANDLPNARRILEHRLPADLTL